MHSSVLSSTLNTVYYGWNSGNLVLFDSFACGPSAGSPLLFSTTAPVSGIYKMHPDEWCCGYRLCVKRSHSV